MAGPLRIVVAGSVASVPGHGGWTWALLQYVLGLRRLGHDVFWIDPVRDASVQPAGEPLARSRNAAYFREVAERFGLTGCSALVRQDVAIETVGRALLDIVGILGAADLLLNVSGVLTHAGLLGSAARRVYLDLDPGYTQLWQAVEGVDMQFDAHTDFVTIGPGLPASDIPTLGRAWVTTLQPVVLGEWPATDAGAIERGAFTTVANWRGYGSITFKGALYGQKAHSFRQFLDLPARSGARFEVALGIHPDETRDLAALRDSGWHLLAPEQVAGSADAYQRFVRESRAELAIAKSGYVAGPTGWFSDRSVCYLASGRPVAAQETGFTRYLPTGQGLLPFVTVEQAVDAVHRIRADYPTHARAARAVAEEFFDSDRVLTRLLRELGAAG